MCLTRFVRWRSGWRAKGLKAGDSVMMIGENEPEHFWAEYAVQSLGGKVLSVYPDQTAEEILYLAEDSQTRVFLAQDQEQVDKCIEIADKYQGAIAIVYWDGSGLWGYDHPLLHSFESRERSRTADPRQRPSRFEEHVKRGRAEDTALLSYTSGTTGKPKGVVISHRYLFDNCSRVMGAIDIAPGTEYLTYISPAWVTEQIFGLSIGLIAPMVVNFPEGPEDVLTNIRELAVDALVFSPRQWENLASIVQARMLGAGKFRNAMYNWGMKVGRDVHVERLEGRSPALPRVCNFPLPRRWFCTTCATILASAKPRTR